MSDKNEQYMDETNGVSRRRFLRTAAAGAGAAALAPALIGCGSDGKSSSSNSGGGSTTPTPSSASAPSAGWTFGIMSDTQWTVTDDGMNPQSCSAEIIRQLNAQFVANGVAFVVHVGDLCDNGSASGEQIRDAYSQTLFNHNIGFFPLRGNHDSSAANGLLFPTLYPQTQNGVMNKIPASALSVTNPDASAQPIPAVSGSSFTVGANFSSPDPWSAADMNGLSYAFDVNGSRFVLLDQFTPGDSNSSYGVTTTIRDQMTWIARELRNRPSGGHAFVFSHKGLITENHVDVLLGSDPSQNPTVTDNFITTLASNGVRLFTCGHDHMHDRSLVYTTDGVSNSVMQLVGASDSSKFYTPAVPANDVTYNQGNLGVTRQVPIQQELYKVGFYLVNLVGQNATIEYWAANVATSNSSGEYLASTIPTLNFTLRETFGYSLQGQQFQIAQGKPFTTVKDTSPNGTVAQILAGSNLSIDQDASGRALVRVVNTGWTTATNAASDVLFLWGIESDLGSEQSETFVLQMSYKSSVLGSALITSGNAGLATLSSAGKWINAVSANYGGTKTFVNGPWQSGYALGTYGVDTTNNVAWAVVNYGGQFAVVNNI